MWGLSEILIYLLLPLALCVALYFWAASPRNSTEAPVQTSEASLSAHTDTSVASPMQTSQTSNASVSTTTQNPQHRLAHEVRQAGNIAYNLPPPSPRHSRLSQINELQKLIDKQKTTIAIMKQLRAESKKAASQLTKAARALPEEPDLEDRDHLLKGCLHRLENRDTGSGDELKHLKAKMESELAEMSDAMTGFSQHYNNAAQLFQELEESA